VFDKIIKENKMSKINSKDGTTIAFDRWGHGPALILVSPALNTRANSPTDPLVALLDPHFTVFTYDRRGRGESSDTPPYAVEREVEDIEALIKEAGGSASLYGMSSGAVLAFEAASRLRGISGLAMYEAPFVVDNSRTQVPQDFLAQMVSMLASGRRGDMVEFFMTKGVGVPIEYIGPMRQQPSWQELEALAHTLIYDITIMGDSQRGAPLSPRWARQAASITAPTLVMAGGASPVWLHNAAHAAVEIIPGAQFRMLEGQTHAVAAEAIAPVLIAFFETELMHRVAR
jgi:pimeloyl-ACP methyl ester carboxylesterase